MKNREMWREEKLKQIPNMKGSIPKNSMEALPFKNSKYILFLIPIAFFAFGSHCMYDAFYGYQEE